MCWMMQQCLDYCNYIRHSLFTFHTSYIWLECLVSFKMVFMRNSLDNKECIIYTFIQKKLPTCGWAFAPQAHGMQLRFVQIPLLFFIFFNAKFCHQDCSKHGFYDDHRCFSHYFCFSVCLQCKIQYGMFKFHRPIQR